MALTILWLSPIPVGLFAGWLHLTWGNLSFAPGAKARIPFEFLGALGLAAGLWTLARRIPLPAGAERRPIWHWRTVVRREIPLGLLAWVAACALITAPVSAISLLVECLLLAGTGGALLLRTGSVFGPAIVLAGVWMTRVRIMGSVEAPFDTIGMIVASSDWSMIALHIWPFVPYKIALHLARGRA